jgi:L-seryl-tRNA(Ser) seleniumtransferase
MVPNGPPTYGALPIGEVVKISHAHGVPVIVDAASQIPAVENLWHFSGNGGPAPWAHALLEAGVTESAPESVAGLGVDLAIFSGGKGLCGPAPTGLLLGRPDLIDSITRQGSPNPLIGRPMKVGKEEICGIVAAVEWCLATDFTALARRYEADVRTVIDGVDGIRGVVATRVWPSESGQPMPRALVTFGPEAPLTRDQMQVRLMGNRPRIAVWNEGDDGFHVNPQTLKPGEASVIADVLRRILRSA